MTVPLFILPAGQMASMRERSIFHNDFNVICPVQPHLQKYTSSRETQITPTNPAILSR
jgi:hypothetical protein